MPVRSMTQRLAVSLCYGAVHDHVILLWLQAAASQEDIGPVPEPDIAPGKVPEPQTKSGCSIS